MMRKECLDGDRIFVIRDFLTTDECHSLIARSEGAGYETASIATAAGPLIDTEVRDNARLVTDDPGMADALWQRASAFVPPFTGGWHVLGLNERFRFYRYDVGQKFRLHYDGFFRRDDREQSQLTFMIYLNDGFTGGETKFYLDDRTLHVVVQPGCGLALVFAHRQLHEGAPVLNGRKYVLRTDVMYSVTPQQGP
jgi:hypothetical protein